MAKIIYKSAVSILASISFFRNACLVLDAIRFHKNTTAIYARSP